MAPDEHPAIRRLREPVVSLGQPARSEFGRFRRLYIRRKARLAARLFERNLDTAGVEADIDHFRSDNAHYEPSDWFALPRVLRYLHPSTDDVFIDIGCGKGRVLHQAARRPFARVVGVEISAKLAEQARVNLAANAGSYRCQNLEVIVADAATFEIPDDVTIAYLYYPFIGATFDATMRNLVASLDRRPRPLKLVYTNPALADRVEQTGRFQLVKRFRGGLYDWPSYRTSVFTGR